MPPAHGAPAPPLKAVSFREPDAGDGPSPSSLPPRQPTPTPGPVPLPLAGWEARLAALAASLAADYGPATAVALLTAAAAPYGGGGAPPAPPS